MTELNVERRGYTCEFSENIILGSLERCSACPRVRNSPDGIREIHALTRDVYIMQDVEYKLNGRKTNLKVVNEINVRSYTKPCAWRFTFRLLADLFIITPQIIWEVFSHAIINTHVDYSSSWMNVRCSIHHATAYHCSRS